MVEGVYRMIVTRIEVPIEGSPITTNIIDENAKTAGAVVTPDGKVWAIIVYKKKITQ